MSGTKELLHIPGFSDVAVIPGQYYETDCIDGREFADPPAETVGTLVYKNEPEFGAVRNPAATLGTMITLKTALPDLNVQDTVRIVSTWGQREFIHTTMHADCGHAALAADGDYKAEYGILAADAKGIREEVEDRAQAGRLVVKTSLPQGVHEEQGLLVVRGIHTVMPKTENGTSFFRFDQQRHEKRLDSLARYVRHVEGISVVSKQLIDVSQHQANVTLGILAEGMPVFDVNLHHGARKIREKGIIRPVGRFTR